MDSGARRRIGTRWLVGFEGATVEDDFLRLLDRYHPGALILFRDNLPEGPDSLAPLRRRLEEAAEGELTLFLDEEGGWIQQLLPEPWPAPRAQAMAGPGVVEACHRAQATALRALGVDAVAAPLADLDGGERNPVIGTRSFGDDPDACAAAVTAALTGIAAGGLLAVLKHYPGHGDSIEDSHLTLPAVPADRERAMIPFRAGVQAGAPALMSAHLRLAGDADSRPATFRPDLMRERLDGELGFTGLVVTDALEMGGTGGIPIEDRGLLALAAGNHLLTLGRWQPGAELFLESSAKALSAGRIRESWLEEADLRWQTFLAARPAAAEGDWVAPDMAALREGAVFRPDGGAPGLSLAGETIDLEFGPLGFWSESEYREGMGRLRCRRLNAEDELQASVYLHVGRRPPAAGRLEELAALQRKGRAPALLCVGPWQWTLPFSRRLATAESSPAGLPALLAAAGLDPC
jgi:beta-N-acetylhexosaminidase